MTTQVDNSGAGARAVPAIELHELRKAYGTTRAVDGVDLVIAPGEVVALLGPNGAGKSTTLDIVLGLGRADSGAVRLFGETPAQAIAGGRVGAMLQTGGLIMNASVRELISVMASLSPHPRDVADILRTTGLESVADQQANKLSGGQTQRVRFALAMVGDPSLLILDEPTAALDVQARHDFWQVMRGFAAEGRTVVFATHYLEEADEYADRIVLMAAGRVVADGSATEIKSVVSVRTIRGTLPGVDAAELLALPGVTAADRRGDSVVLTCTSSDDALRALVARYAAFHDIEVRGGGLDEAFRQLTGDGRETAVVFDDESGVPA
jgi:ABC-2 type transport system ATP-binding protein